MATSDQDTAAIDSGLRIIKDAACPECGCVCDDIDVSVKDNTIVAADRSCALGKPWFLNNRADPGPSCHIAGQPATVDEGIERAAQLLSAAKYPLVYGLENTTCEAQRVAVAIGDWIGGTVDTTTSTRHGPTGVSFHGVGEVTCTLGEMANRGDLIVLWGCDPAESHPRHFAKYSLMPEGMFVPGGRADRTCVLVDVRKTQSAEAADVFLRIKPGKDFEALWILRALAGGRASGSRS